MKDSLIQPTNFNIPTLTKNCILIFNPFLFFEFREFVSGGKVKSFGVSKRFSFHINNSDVSVVGGMIGAPQALITLENMQYGGVKNIVSLGTAGCLTEVNEDELIRSVNSTKDGTFTFQELNREQEEKAVPFYKQHSSNQIYTTNLLYNLTCHKKKSLLKEGINLIDMEFAAVQAFCCSVDLQLRNTFVISDYINTQDKFVNLSKSDEFQSSKNRLYTMLKDEAFNE